MLRCFAALCFLLVTIAPAWPRDVGSELAEIREIALLVSPELANSPTETMTAVMLRDQIHRSVLSNAPDIPNLTSTDLDDWATAYRLSVLNRSRSNACNGKAILYMLALRSFGIPSRLVTLYADQSVGIIATSHASVSVLADGKWVAMDPTFNISLTDNSGRYLSWKEAITRLRNGSAVNPSSDGQPALIGHSLDDYRAATGATLKSLSTFALLGPWREGKAENLNPAWDGKLNYIDGNSFDAWGSITSDFYKSIAGRPRQSVSTTP